MNKKYILGGGLVLLSLFAIGGKKQKPIVCSNGKSFEVNGEKVCEDKLNELGFFYWRQGTAGAGYYSINDFMNVFNFPSDFFESEIIKLVNQSNDPTHPSTNSSQNFLINSVKPTAVILKQL